MINPVQTRMIQQISSNKDKYLSLAGDSKESLEKLYDKFSKTLTEYSMALMDEIGARQVYNASLKKHKIDPYIAGGMAEGVAGVGAGLYASTSAASRNKAIDASRKSNKYEVIKSSVATAGVEGALINILEKLDEKLNSISEIKEDREKEVENLYLQAKKIVNESSNREEIKKAKDIFLSLGDYKTSALYINKCDNRISTLRQRKIFIFSLFGAIIAPILGGMASAGSGPFLLVAVLAFIIAEIIFQFYIK